MITIGINRGRRPFYNTTEFLCDYESDVADLPINKGAGSKAYVIENGNVYILNQQHEWILQPKNSSGSSDGGDSNDTIIYDGGVIS